MSIKKLSEEKLAWVKEILLCEWKPRIKSPEPEKDLNNTIDSLPFDLSEDLYNLLQESRLRRKQNMSKENKENVDTTFESPAKNISNIRSRISKSHESLVEKDVRNSRKNFNTTNDSFLYLEEICNKTVSDPNSTIHNYVSQLKERNQNSINSVAEEKYSSDDECAAIHRLLSEVDITSNTMEVLKQRAEKYENHSIIMNDETQLDEIEAPSLLWNTTAEDGGESSSTKKRADLMRFSTIFEESNFSNDANNVTFRIPNKPSTSYETANRQSTVADQSTCYETAKEQSTTFETAKDQSTSYATTDRILAPIDNGSVDLTLDNSTETNESEVDTIEVLDDSTEELAPKSESKSEIYDNNSLIADDSIQSNESYTFNVSREFNDTLEEVEYIMKQSDLKLSGTKPKIVSDIELQIKHPIEKTKSPIPVNKNLCKPDLKKNSPCQLKINSPIFGNMRATSPSTPNLIVKNDLFKKPMSGISAATQQSRKKFAHVISPVGAYIKRTAQTPLFTNIKSTTVQSLDYREIATRIQYFPLDDQTNQIAQRANAAKCALPKKAYVSSNYFNIKDERKPYVIPGGEKIHRYLGPALLPQVICHEGKAKVDLPKRDDHDSTVDSSLADLSVMSGNVSLYTIKDAQDFSSNKPTFVKKFH